MLVRVVVTLDRRIAVPARKGRQATMTCTWTRKHMAGSASQPQPPACIHEHAVHTEWRVHLITPTRVMSQPLVKATT